MLSSGLALLRMRMICLIWPWVTLLLMQPNTTRALGCSDGLYWKANLESQRETALPWQQGKVPLQSREKSSVLLGELGPLVQPLAGWDVPHAGLRHTGRTSASSTEPPKTPPSTPPLTSMISSRASVTVSREDRAKVSLS